MVKLLLIDKDGTLVRPKSGHAFVQSLTDQEPIEGVREALERHKDWEIVIISNQGGVLAGHKTLESAIAEMRYCFDLFPSIKEAYFCPDDGRWCWNVHKDYKLPCSYENVLSERQKTHLTDLEVSFRKPNPGMLNMAAKQKLRPILNQILYVGDRPEDEQAAAAAGIPFMWADEWRRQQ